MTALEHKNCLNCDNLEWDSEDDGLSSSAGLNCPKRQGKMNQREEHEFLLRLKKNAYLVSSKRCFDPKQIIPAVQRYA